jgi:hypothetical protein
MAVIAEFERLYVPANMAAEPSLFPKPEVASF